jgi:hypothetical protein
VILSRGNGIGIVGWDMGVHVEVMVDKKVIR